MTRRFITILSMGLALAAISCNVDPNPDVDVDSDSSSELASYWYSGGVLGTAFNSTSRCFEQETTPVTETSGWHTRFLNGADVFDRTWNANSTGVRHGVGPIYMRNSCKGCHPGYAHGSRITSYDSTDPMNGSIVAVVAPDGSIVSSLGFTYSTQALTPFKPAVDETQIEISWLSYTDEWGNKFDDGETYDLIYPEVYIPESAFYVPLVHNGEPIAHSELSFCLESTVGVYGQGLIDAIDDADLLAEYQRQEALGVELNPSIYANGQWVKTGTDGGGYRMDYDLAVYSMMTNGSLWSVTGITRSGKRSINCTTYYAQTASQDPDVQADFYTYYPDWNITGDPETDIYNFFTSSEHEVEISDDDYYSYMIWFRGLAVPAARNMDNEDVQLGMSLFSQIGCAECHRPSWTTGSDDPVRDPFEIFTGKDLPQYPYQTIWPYTDLVQHRLFMKNDFRGDWVRTTQLWGRGLYQKTSGSSEEDRLHDNRARNVLEAIMWHGSASSDARWTVENFRALSKDERDAICTFINCI